MSGGTFRRSSRRLPLPARLVALGLALLHVALFAGGSALHGFGHERALLDVADLPAWLHHHDYGIVAGGEDPVPAEDHCLGCMIQSTIGPPLGTTDDFVDGATRSNDLAANRSLPPDLSRDGPLSRAPPV